MPGRIEAQLDEAVGAASAAFVGWRETSMDERRTSNNKIADTVEANGEELARVLTQEQGKPLQDAMGEVMGMATFFRYFQSLDLPIEVLEDSDTQRVELHRKPIGVVGAIIPWNFPAYSARLQITRRAHGGQYNYYQARADNSARHFAIRPVNCRYFPAGVVNIIADQNDLGGKMTIHGIDKISFTGSTATGQKVMASAASTLKRITLELGGNDAGIVLDDVDVEAIAPQIFQGAFGNNGQICIAMKRVYAHESIYDRLCDELAKLAKQAVVGDGLQQGTQIGPLQNKMQYDKIKDYLEVARKMAKSLPVVQRQRQGYFVPPTIAATLPMTAVLWRKSNSVRCAGH